MPQLTNYAYSFQDISCSIVGAGGSGLLSTAGIANEGISVESNERVTTQFGADGSWMHSLHAAQGGKVTIRVMKNGAANSLLDGMCNFDMASSANMGRNLISVRNPVTGDSWTAIGCAFTKKPVATYNVEGPAVEWTFNVGQLSGVFGSGSPSQQ